MLYVLALLFHRCVSCLFRRGVGTLGSRKKSGSHIGASLSRQPLVKGERLVRYEVNAVMQSVIQLFSCKSIMRLSWCSRQVCEAGACGLGYCPLHRIARRQNILAAPGVPTMLKDGGRHSYLLGLLAMIKCSICSYQCDN